MVDYLTTMISQLRWVDILDIAIIAFAIYKILKYIQETRAFQLLMGLIVLLVATVLSDVLKLYTVNWLLEGLLKVGVIALIVIFQPEIRRFLQYLGGFWLRSSYVNLEESDTLTEDIMSALKYFSRNKVGALIVFERNTVLGDIVESGIPINADISKELIMNVFYSGAPLHDGAVIIRGDKVIAAGCVLPLTSSTNLSSELGTRHRAGIGVTEISDAIAVIVSEETGAMSVATNGKISRFMDNNSMQKIIKSVFMNEAESERTFFKPFFNRLRGKSNE
ncbi:MAG: diadenylate cyclase CdaA [Firmicutes bacterium]|jgi:diadenylate cyclase|nr:diadenylate cyclase CdaA [Bacillota bacterium]MBR2576511.1 diadenylate cyclase CdaA [Bacillota bacterium]